jgi:hypothetical protein
MAITITITNEVHDALLSAIDMMGDLSEIINDREAPYAGEMIGDVRDLLNMILLGDLSTIGK